MKRLVLGICMLLILAQALPAAAEPISYGESVLEAGMEGYVYMTVGRTRDEMWETTDEKTHSGNKSFKVNTDTFVNESDQLYLSRQVDLAGEDMLDENMRIDFYVYGVEADKNPPQFEAQVRLLDETGNPAVAGAENHPQLAVEEAENGWKHFYTLVKSTDIQRVQAKKVSLSLWFQGIMTDCPPIYVDDVTIRKVPEKLVIYDVVSNSRTVNLNTVRVFGENEGGRRQEIFAKDLLRYTSSDPAAAIDKNNNLTIPENCSALSVTAEFFGVTATFGVESEPEITVTMKKGENGAYLLEADNYTGTQIPYFIAAVLYDGEALAGVSVQQGTLPAGAGTVTFQPDFPVYMDGYQMKLYYKTARTGLEVLETD